MLISLSNPAAMGKIHMLFFGREVRIVNKIPRSWKFCSRPQVDGIFKIEVTLFLLYGLTISRQITYLFFFLNRWKQFFHFHPHKHTALCKCSKLTVVVNICFKKKSFRFWTWRRQLFFFLFFKKEFVNKRTKLINMNTKEYQIRRHLWKWSMGNHSTWLSGNNFQLFRVIIFRYSWSDSRSNSIYYNLKTFLKTEILNPEKNAMIFSLVWKNWKKAREKLPPDGN